MTTKLESVASQPAMIAQYGRPKLGKTSDVLFSFPRAVWIAAPGALKPSLGLVGYEPKNQFYCEFVRDATTILKGVPPGRFDAVVIDDLTLLVERTVAALERQGVKGFELWGSVYRQTLALREQARACGLHVVLNSHEVPPGMDESGRYWQGSMALPGKKLPYSIPAACDMVVRAAPADDVTIGWPVRYLCDPAHTEWITGDRHNVLPAKAPMNLGEALRLVARVSGHVAFAPRRLEGLEWQEAMVEKAAQAIVPMLEDLDGVKAILKQVRDYALAKYTKDERHALWTVRDAYDRATLLAGLSAHRSKHYGF